jgi:NADH-quinone oxidoreductase subunit E
VSALPPVTGRTGAAAGAAGGAAARRVGGSAGARAAADVAAALASPLAAPAPPKAAEFPPAAIREECDEIVKRYPTRLAAALPVLHVAQRHYGGWISPEVEAGVARYLECPDQHVRGLLTFYAMYHHQPRGKHEVWVCRTLTCWLRGAGSLTRLARQKAGLADVPHPPQRETGPDGKFTVMEMECLGLCERAPAVFVDGTPHVDVTPERLGELLDRCG